MIQVHKVSEGQFVVSENGIWVPGSYDSCETAKLAPQLKDEEIEFLLGPIYRVDGLARPVNMDDMLLALQASKEMREKRRVYMEQEMA